MPLSLSCDFLWLVSDPPNKQAGRIDSVCFVTGTIAVFSSRIMMDDESG